MKPKKSEEKLKNHNTKNENFYTLIKRKVEIFDFRVIAIIFAIFCLLIFPIDIVFGIPKYVINQFGLSFPSIQIPNFFGILPNQASDILSIIIGALSSILGVIIAVILLAFQILKKGYNNYVFHSFFKERRLSELITVYLLTITISYFTILSLKDPLDHLNINLIYFSIFLFLISLWMLFPYSSNIIASTQPKGRIKNLINKISVNYVESHFINNNIYPTFYMDKIEKNPVMILNDLSIRTLKDNDWFTSIVITDEIEKKIKKLLESIPSDNHHTNKNKKRKVINFFTVILKTISDQSIKNQFNEPLYSILEYIKNIHNYCATNNVPWYEVNELNGYLENFLEKIIANNISSFDRLGLEMTKSIMKMHLEKNIPEENDIWSLHFNDGKDVVPDSSKENQWRNVSQSYIHIISNLGKKAIKMGNSESVGNCISTLTIIVVEVQEMEMGPLQKKEIIRNSCNEIETLMEGSFNADIYNGIFALNYLADGVEIAAENSEEDIVREILFSMTGIILDLTEKEALNWHTLNSIAVIGRKFANKTHENLTYNRSFRFIIELFDKIREKMEEKIDTKIYENKKSYLELYEQTKSLKEWYDKNEIKDKQITDLLEKKLSKFKMYEKIKKEIEMKTVTVKWPV